MRRPTRFTRPPRAGRFPATLLALAWLVPALAACAGEGRGTASVRIREPADGAVVGPDVHVVLQAEGIEIAPAAEARPGTGHHHLFLDVDLTPLDEVIPAGQPNIVHKGDGTAEHTFTGLEPGPHRIIAVIANPAHVPVDPPAVDTVRFTVER